MTYLVETEETGKPLVFDCQGIVTIDDHALEGVSSALRKIPRPLLFTNTNAIEAELRRDLGEYTAKYIFGEAPVIVFGDDTIDRDVARRIIEQVEISERAYVSKCVGDCFRPFPNGPQRMSSTPLLASGVFDARPLISDREKFSWISILMADRLDKFLDQSLQLGQATPQRTKSFRLLAVSLRGSPFAAAIGLLSDRQQAIEIVDHVGPKYKILEDPALHPSTPDDDYIYVGDFVVGGTELRIAQAYARGKGARIKHAFVVGKVLQAEDYRLDFEISSLVDLMNCCPTARFSF